MTIHELKIWPQYFDAIASGIKTFEVRKDDRGFAVGDTLVLKEWKLIQHSLSPSFTVNVAIPQGGGCKIVCVNSR